MRICFDLDGVICDSTQGYINSVVRPEVVETIKRLKTQGHTIIVSTARLKGTYAGNTGRVIAEIGAITLQQLDDWGVPYDEVDFNKVGADLYIDDKGHRYTSLESLRRSCGLCND